MDLYINFTGDLALLFHKTGEIIREDHSSGIDASKKKFQLLLLEKLLWEYIRTYKQKCERAEYLEDHRHTWDSNGVVTSPFEAHNWRHGRHWRCIQTPSVIPRGEIYMHTQLP